jgi:hypothetical protein
MGPGWDGIHESPDRSRHKMFLRHFYRSKHVEQLKNQSLTKDVLTIKNHRRKLSIEGESGDSKQVN